MRSRSRRHPGLRWYDRERLRDWERKLARPDYWPGGLMLRSVRAYLRLTQGEMAQAFDVTDRTVRAWEARPMQRLPEAAAAVLLAIMRRTVDPPLPAPSQE